ncbi:MAG: hypothetical protein IKX18_07080 [Muribaculaceae bacterium]|nr:hypothetical protein [Muribaculaceae bacterium]
MMKKVYMILLLACLLSGIAAWGHQAPVEPDGEEEAPLVIMPSQVGPETLGRYVVLYRMADFTMNTIYDYDGHSCLCRFDQPPYLPTVLCWGYDLYGVVEQETDYFTGHHYYVHVNGIHLHPEESGVVDVSRFSSVYALPDCSIWQYFTLNCRFWKPITVIHHYGDYLYAMDCEGQIGLIRGADGRFAEGDRIQGGEVYPRNRDGLAVGEMIANFDSDFELVEHGDPVTPTWTTIGQMDLDKVYGYFGFEDVNIKQDTPSGQVYLCDLTGANIKLDDLFHIGLVAGDVTSPYDVNSDGEVSIADVNRLMSIILTGTVEQQWLSPEDDNGAYDVIAILDAKGVEPVLYPTRIVRHGSHSILRGDANEDGEVNIADVNAVIDMILSR